MALRDLETKSRISAEVENSTVINCRNQGCALHFLRNSTNIDWHCADYRDKSYITLSFEQGGILKLKIS